MPERFAIGLVTLSVVVLACRDDGIVGPQPTSVVVAPSPASVVVGQSLQLTATMRDAGGNGLPATNVTWTSSNLRLAMVSQSGLVSGVAVGGPVTITAVAAGLSGTSEVTVVVGPPTQLTITTQPSGSATSGIAFAQQPVIQLRNATGHEVRQSGVVVIATLGTGGGTLANPTATTDDNGRAAFNGLAILGAAATYSLRFDSPGLASVTSQAIALSAAPAAQLTIMTQPSATAQNGVEFPRQPVLEVRDQSGSPVIGQSVFAAIASGGGSLEGTTTVVTSGDGVATFTDLAVTGTIGVRTLIFTEGSAVVVSNAIGITPGPSAMVGITTQPSATPQNGVEFPQQPVVEVRDGSGNVVSGESVTATIVSGGGTLGGTTTVTTGPGGVATFTDLSITGTIGDRTLKFAAGSISATSSTIALQAGAPATLAITVQPPSTAVSGVTLGQPPQVAVRDASGNLVAGQDVTVAIALGGGALGGTPVVSTNASGVATFGDLSIAGAPGDRTLSFSLGPLDALSDPIALAFGQGTQLSLQYCSSPGGPLLMDVFIPSNSFPRPLPAAVYIHGGGWTSGDKSSGLLLPEVRDELLLRGFLVATLNYRLAPTWQWPAQIHDVKCGIRHFRAEAQDYGLDPASIGVWGASAGGHLVAMLGVTDASSGLEGSLDYLAWSSRVAAVVSIGGISDLRPPAQSELTFAGPEVTFDTWPGPSQELVDASPVTWASGDDPPFLIVHGEQDPTVLVAQPIRMRDALKAAGGTVTLQLVTNGGHNLEPVTGPVSPPFPQIIQQIASFFDGTLRFSMTAVRHSLESSGQLTEPR